MKNTLFTNKYKKNISNFTKVDSNVSKNVKKDFFLIIIGQCVINNCIKNELKGELKGDVIYVETFINGYERAKEFFLKGHYKYVIFFENATTCDKMNFRFDSKYDIVCNTGEFADENDSLCKLINGNIIAVNSNIFFAVCKNDVMCKFDFCKLCCLMADNIKFNIDKTNTTQCIIPEKKINIDDSKKIIIIWLPPGDRVMFEVYYKILLKVDHKYRRLMITDMHHDMNEKNNILLLSYEYLKYIYLSKCEVYYTYYVVGNNNITPPFLLKNLCYDVTFNEKYDRMDDNTYIYINALGAICDADYICDKLNANYLIDYEKISYQLEKYVSVNIDVIINIGDINSLKICKNNIQTIKKTYINSHIHLINNTTLEILCDELDKKYISIYAHVDENNHCKENIVLSNLSHYSDYILCLDEYCELCDVDQITNLINKIDNSCVASGYVGINNNKYVTHEDSENLSIQICAINTSIIMKNEIRFDETCVSQIEYELDFNKKLKKFGNVIKLEYPKKLCCVYKKINNCLQNNIKYYNKTDDILLNINHKKYLETVKICLVGKNNTKGLGTITRSLVDAGQLARVVIIEDSLSFIDKINNAVICTSLNAIENNKKKQREILEDIDIVIILEFNLLNLTETCKQHKIKVIRMVNYEYFDEHTHNNYANVWCSSSKNMINVNATNKFELFQPVNMCNRKAIDSYIEFIIISTGSEGINGYNGCDLIIDSFFNLKNNGELKNVKLIIQESLNLSNGIKSIVDLYKIDKDIVIEKISLTEVFAKYENILYVNIQNFRATSLPIQEAYSMNIPVITTNITPFNEYLNNEFLVYPSKKTLSVPLNDNNNIHCVKNNMTYTFNQPIVWYDISQKDLEKKLLQVCNMKKITTNNEKTFTVDKFYKKFNNIIASEYSSKEYGYNISKLYRFDDMTYCQSSMSPININAVNDVNVNINLDDNLVNLIDTCYRYIALFHLSEDKSSTINNISVNINNIEITNIFYVDNCAYVLFYEEKNYNEYDRQYKNKIICNASFLKKIECMQIIKIPVITTTGIIYVGNFVPVASTETHISKEYPKIGVNCINLQEDNIYQFKSIINVISKYVYIQYVLYTRTWGYLTLSDLEYLNSIQIKSVSYHLDLYYPLERKHTVKNDPFWYTDYVFITDCDPDAIKFYKHFNPNIHELYAGVYSKDAIMFPTVKYEHDVIFVGSGSINGEYHREWQYRQELLKFLSKFENFAKYGSPGKNVRNNELNKLYSKSKIVVGDCININFTYKKYWSDRVYETIGRGGFLIFPYIEGLECEFEDKKHIVYYKYGNFEELEQLINYYLLHDEEREAIRLCGYEKCKKNYTYKHRITKLHNYVITNNTVLFNRSVVINNFDMGEFFMLQSADNLFLSEMAYDDKQIAVTTKIKKNNTYLRFISVEKNKYFIQNVYTNNYMCGSDSLTSITKQNMVTFVSVPTKKCYFEIIFKKYRDVTYVKIINCELSQTLHTHYYEVCTGHYEVNIFGSMAWFIISNCYN